jgi:hypothetical protein
MFEKNKKRAKRRHDDNRLLKKSVFFCKNVMMRSDEKYARKRRDTRKPCSCWMCGNPRRVYGTKTMQEQKAETREGRPEGHEER